MCINKTLGVIIFLSLPFINSYAQNVGIGTITPAYNLDIHSQGNAQFNLIEGIGGHTALFSRYSNRLEIQPSDAFEISVGGIDQRNLTVANNGYVGINTTAPSTRLQVLTADASYGITHTNGTVTIGTFIGSGGGWIGTQSNHPLYFFTNNSNAQMSLTTKGYLGIGTITPTNQLQVGTYTNAGYGGNQLALGFGTNVTVLNQYASLSNFQSSAALNIQSASNIYLMPGNGNGYVGINTNTPTYPLEIGGTNYATDNAPAAELMVQFAGAVPAAATEGVNQEIKVSLFVGGTVEADVYYAVSDSRIKNIIGTSNNANDLELIDKIKVIDYTMKDRMTYGNRSFKKVVAQELEEVYPQVVNKQTNFIPNTYQRTGKIIKSDKGYVLHFNTAHNISKNAKFLKVYSKKGDLKLQVINVSSDLDVEVKAENLSDSLFVYGEEVNDFRTVDYEGLTILNISATQELSKLVKQQQTEINAQNSKIDALTTEIELMKKNMHK